MQHSNFYEIFRSYQAFALTKVFYSNHQTASFEEHVLANKHHPAIFTADHQNALIDALNLASSVNREFQPFFMTRSDVFGSKFDMFLYRWKMRPIYRRQDNIIDVAKANEETFNEMVAELGNGDRVLIFPEGNHGRIRRLRPLKKGFARIGFQAEEVHNFSLDLLIQPTGINYWEHLNPGAEVLVKFGPPLKFSDYYELYQENPNKALINIRKDLFNAMKKLIHHITEVEYYDVIDFSREAAGPALLKEAEQDPSDLNLRFEKEQEIIDQLEPQVDGESDTWTEFASGTLSYKAALEEADITDAEVSDPAPSAARMYLKGLFYILWYPVYLVGTALHILPYAFGNRTAVKNFKDDHFHSSIRFTLPMLIYPVYWLILWLVGWAISWSLSFGFLWLGCILITGLFSLKYARGFKTFKRKWRWFSASKAKKEEIRTLRDSWYTKLTTWMSAPVPEKA